MKMKMKIKIWTYWISGFIGSGFGFTQNHLFLMGFHFLKPYPPNHPTQPTVFGFLLGGFARFFGFTQPMYTPICVYVCVIVILRPSPMGGS